MVIKSRVLLMAGLISLSSVGCKTEHGTSGAKDVVVGEGDSASLTVIWVEGQQVLLGSCPKSVETASSQQCKVVAKKDTKDFAEKIQENYLLSVDKKELNEVETAALKEFLDKVGTTRFSEAPDLGNDKEKIKAHFISLAPSALTSQQVNESEFASPASAASAWNLSVANRPIFNDTVITTGGILNYTDFFRVPGGRLSFATLNVRADGDRCFGGISGVNVVLAGENFSRPLTNYGRGEFGSIVHGRRLTITSIQFLLSVRAGGACRITASPGDRDTGDGGGHALPSDERLKDNIVPLLNALEALDTLKAYRYEWKNKEVYGEAVEIGLLAQEVNQVFPEAVEVKENGELHLKYNNLVAVIVAAIAELNENQKLMSDEIKTLKEQLNQR